MIEIEFYGELGRTVTDVTKNCPAEFAKVYSPDAPILAVNSSSS